jgi:hypothetical protein
MDADAAAAEASGINPGGLAILLDLASGCASVEMAGCES